MRTRFILHASVATLLVGAFALVADALVVSDEEALTALADDLTQSDASRRVDDTLQWVDVSREPLSLRAEGRTRRFGDGDDGRATDALSAAFAGFGAGDLEVVQRSVQVDGERATVAVRVRADGEVRDATFRLARHGQGWLISHATSR